MAHAMGVRREGTCEEGKKGGVLQRTAWAGRDGSNGRGRRCREGNSISRACSFYAALCSLVMFCSSGTAMPNVAAETQLDTLNTEIGTL